MKVKSIITISGRICSGKSFTAKFISDLTGFPIVSFGSYLKHYCKEKNLPTDRKTLQDVGEAFIKENAQQFLINVISNFTESFDSIILEGIRHKTIFDEIGQISEKHLSIFVEADLETRYKRYSERDKDSDEVKTFEQFQISDNHPVELEIESIRPLSSIILDSTIDNSVELKKIGEGLLS